MNIAPISPTCFGRLFLSAAVLLLVHPAAVSQEEMLSSAAKAAKPVEQAEPEEPGCRSPKINAVTDQPTASTSTDTTQCGVLEVVSGFDRVWQGHGVHQDDATPSFQFGLTPRLDLHYSRGTFFGVGAKPGPFSGAGDTFVGARYKLSKQSKFVPSFGTLYTLKVPTAPVADGMGSGHYDHSAMVIVSKDVRKVHFDVNVAPNLIARSERGGFDKNTLMVLSSSVPLRHRLTLTGGAFGTTSLNADVPAAASATAGFLWQVKPRLILAAGFDEGLTTGAPRKRIGFGFTYAPANLYALVAGPRERTK